MVDRRSCMARRGRASAVGPVLIPLAASCTTAPSCRATTAVTLERGTRGPRFMAPVLGQQSPGSLSGVVRYNTPELTDWRSPVLNSRSVFVGRRKATTGILDETHIQSSTFVPVCRSTGPVGGGVEPSGTRRRSASRRTGNAGRQRRPRWSRGWRPGQHSRIPRLGARSR